MEKFLQWKKRLKTFVVLTFTLLLVPGIRTRHGASNYHHPAKIVKSKICTPLNLLIHRIHTQNEIGVRLQA